MSSSFSHAAMYLTRYEQQGTGLHWDQFWQSPLADDDTSFGFALCFTFLDALLYSIIALIILSLRGKVVECQYCEHTI